MMEIIVEKCTFYCALLKRVVYVAKSKKHQYKNIIKNLGSTAITVVITLGLQYVLGYSGIEAKIDNLAERVNSLESTIEANKSDLTGKIDGLSKDIVDLKVSVATLNATVFQYRPTNVFSSAITSTYAGIDNPYTSESVQLSSTTMIAYSNFDASREYSVKELANQALLLPYTEDDKEVYFYGQLDELGKWDGRCVVNIYEDNKLWLITDAQYDSGELIRCKQAFPDSSTGGQDVWVISERKIEDGYSSGETWRYFRSGDYLKDFTLDDVQLSDMLSVDMFQESMCVTQEGYYYGNISDGKYNDDTGSAYLCKYFDDGTVRTLYVGQFRDGQFNDSTGNAWMIGRMDKTSAYSYYKGPFENGSAMKDPELWIEPLTIEQVEEITNIKQFNCELKWETPLI